MNTKTRDTIGTLIIIGSILLFGWYGLFSLIFALPFIGWNLRHKGPFGTQSLTPQFVAKTYKNFIQEQGVYDFEKFKVYLAKKREFKSKDQEELFSKYINQLKYQKVDTNDDEVIGKNTADIEKNEIELPLTIGMLKDALSTMNAGDMVLFTMAIYLAENINIDMNKFELLMQELYKNKIPLNLITRLPV